MNTWKSKTCLLAKAPSGFALVRHPNHIVAKCNPRFDELLKCKVEQGQSLYEFIPKHEALLHALDQAYAIGASFCVPNYEVSDGFVIDVQIDAFDGGLMMLVNDRESSTNDKKIQTQLSLALESAHSGVWWLDLASNRVVASRETAKIYGRDEINMNIDRAIDEMVDLRDQPRVREKIAESIQNKGAFHVEFRINRADGTSGWSEGRGCVECDSQGRPLRLIGVQSDISAQKLTALNLQMEKAKLESIFVSSPAAMALCRGPDLIFEKHNPAYKEYFKGRDFLERPFREVFHELKSQPFEALARQVYETGIPFHAREMPAHLIRKKGEEPEERFLDFTYAQITDPQGERYGVYIHTIDVTDRVIVRKALEANQEKLRQIESRLRKAVTVAKVGFFDWNITEDALTLSPQMKHDWGIDGEITFKEALNLMHPDDRRLVEQKIQCSIETRTTYYSKYRIVKPGNDEIVWIEAQGEVSYDDEGKPSRFFGTSVDVSEQKKTELALQEARLEAERANTAKSTFLANMSHEIRSPLGAIMGYSDLLKSTSISKEEASHFVAAIDRNSQHLLRIIDDILDLSKVEAGKMMIERIDFSLLELLSDLMHLMELKAQDKGIVFHLNIPEPIPDRLIADPTRIRQVLSNVVGNAIKFTERGRVQLNVSFQEPFLEFRVIDTGPGISPEQVELLFQPFHQADVSTTRKFGGTGLGLILTRRIAEAMSGQFDLEQSTPGRGSTFVAKLQVDLPAAYQMINGKCLDRLPLTPADCKRETNSLEGLRILVVEDSPDNQFLFDHVLSTAGASVDIAQDGYEGLHMALLNQYDTILMDVQMPRMDGHEATKTLRRKGIKLPIIALTAHAMKEEKQRSLLTGFTDFLSKPVPQDQLIAMILRYQKKASRRTMRSLLN